MPGPLKIGYWSIRGLGAPLRMMAEYADATYEAVLFDVEVKPDGGGFDRSCWLEPKRAILERNPLANLPFIEDDGLLVCQSNACFVYLGDKFGLLGASSIERIECEQLLCEVMDLRNSLVKTFYGGGDLAELMRGPNLGKLSAWLKLKGTTFLVTSANPTAPDFHLWELLDQLKLLSEVWKVASWAESFPNLVAYYEAFSSLAFMAKYKASPLAKLPINNKMAIYGATPEGGTWDLSVPQSFDGKSQLRGIRNQALVFVKPHAVTTAVVSLVKGYFAGKGIRVLSEGSISAEEIDSKKLIDQHYYAIASKATILKPNQLNVPSDKFEAQFGMSWEAALSTGNVYNAMDACAQLGISADEMDKQWGICKKAKKLVKFGGGFYCGLIELEGKTPLYVFNGFFMSMRSKFTAPGESIHYFSVEWESESLSWAAFRSQALGPTDPAEAPPTSLRGMVLSDWKALGLKLAPDVGENACHASASPFEALAERMNWLGAAPGSDPFGQLCLSAGLDEAILRAWSVDPQVTLPGGAKGSLFDAVEDMNAKRCLDALLAIKACQ